MENANDENLAKTGQLDWPAWASWALAATLLTSLLTIATTLNDIW